MDGWVNRQIDSGEPWAFFSPDWVRGGIPCSALWSISRLRAVLFLAFPETHTHSASGAAK